MKPTIKTVTILPTSYVVVIQVMSATTFVIPTLSLKGLHVTLSVSNSITTLCYYAECHVLFIIMLNVLMVSVIMLNVVMVSVIMVNVVMLSALC